MHVIIKNVRNKHINAIFGNCQHDTFFKEPNPKVRQPPIVPPQLELWYRDYLVLRPEIKYRPEIPKKHSQTKKSPESLSTLLASHID